MFELTITPGELDLATLRRVSREPVHVSLDPAALPGIHASAAVVTKVIEQNRVVYGINTGFGLLANTRIPVEQLDELQRSIVLSHAAGIGEYMDDATVRLMMVLKLNSLARGFSGIRLTVLEALMTLINAEVYPVVPKKGSVGASGDLAPLAHMSCLLIGEGKARHKGELIDAATALK
ncbi:MAG: aromatic amino acid lyase, partial [Aeromonas veronii]